MKCPKCKKNLKTKRTIAHEHGVSRERFCKKCKRAYHTSEFFDFIYNETVNGYENRISKMTELYEEVMNDFEEVKETIRNFFLLVKKTRR